MKAQELVKLKKMSD